jgi:hypothetical protein
MAPQETLTIPTQRHGASVQTSTSPNRSKKTWQSRVPFSSSRDRNQQRLGREHTRQSGTGSKKSAWWKTRLFSGMYNDIRRRAPFYWSDWKDAWDYRVVPATVYMYFAKYVLTIHSNIHTTSPSHTYSICAAECLREFFRTDFRPAYYLLWLSPSTCLRRQTRASALMRCSCRPY